MAASLLPKVLICPSTAEAIRVYHQAKIHFGPGKAANAEGVAVSGLEMSQNAIGQQWSHEKVDHRLKLIMENIHKTCVRYGKEPNGYINYLKGANIGGFLKSLKPSRLRAFVLISNRESSRRSRLVKSDRKCRI